MKKMLPSLTLATLAMWAMKRYYSDAPVDELRWIIGPTARLVTALTGVPFEWDSGQGYLSRERFFVIEKACAGINFMIAAFGMLAVVRCRRIESWRSAAGVLPFCLLASYSMAVLVNAVRITLAMWLAAHPVGFAWITAVQAHRVEGIACYFGGLVLLYRLVQQVDRRSDVLHQSMLLLVPLFWYYVITVVVPLVNRGYGEGFVEHTMFVLVVPLVLVALAALGSQLVRGIWRAT